MEEGQGKGCCDKYQIYTQCSSKSNKARPIPSKCSRDHRKLNFKLFDETSTTTF